uniref:Uncharacterized protein n=1 Tax=Chaetoceros debilis TaxID=122233 RepID=A0A7S3V6D9_9STRA
MAAYSNMLSSLLNLAIGGSSDDWTLPRFLFIGSEALYFVIGLKYFLDYPIKIFRTEKSYERTAINFKNSLVEKTNTLLPTANHKSRSILMNGASEEIESGANKRRFCFGRKSKVADSSSLTEEGRVAQSPQQQNAQEIRSFIEGVIITKHQPTKMDMELVFLKEVGIISQGLVDEYYEILEEHESGIVKTEDIVLFIDLQLEIANRSNIRRLCAAAMWTMINVRSLLALVLMAGSIIAILIEIFPRSQNGNSCKSDFTSFESLAAIAYLVGTLVFAAQTFTYTRDSFDMEQQLKRVVRKWLKHNERASRDVTEWAEFDDNDPFDKERFSNLLEETALFLPKFQLNILFRKTKGGRNSMCKVDLENFAETEKKWRLMNIWCWWLTSFYFLVTVIWTLTNFLYALVSQICGDGIIGDLLDILSSSGSQMRGLASIFGGLFVYLFYARVKAQRFTYEENVRNAILTLGSRELPEDDNDDVEMGVRWDLNHRPISHDDNFGQISTNSEGEALEPFPNENTITPALKNGSFLGGSSVDAPSMPSSDGSGHSSVASSDASGLDDNASEVSSAASNASSVPSEASSVESNASSTPSEASSAKSNASSTPSEALNASSTPSEDKSAETNASSAPSEASSVKSNASSTRSEDKSVESNASSEPSEESSVKSNTPSAPSEESSAPSEDKSVHSDTPSAQSKESSVPSSEPSEEQSVESNTPSARSEESSVPSNASSTPPEVPSAPSVSFKDPSDPSLTPSDAYSRDQLHVRSKTKSRGIRPESHSYRDNFDRAIEEQEAMESSEIPKNRDDRTKDPFRRTEQEKLHSPDSLFPSSKSSFEFLEITPKGIESKGSQNRHSPTITSGAGPILNLASLLGDVFNMITDVNGMHSAPSKASLMMGDFRFVSSLVSKGSIVLTHQISNQRIGVLYLCPSNAKQRDLGLVTMSLSADGTILNVDVPWKLNDGQSSLEIELPRECGKVCSPPSFFFSRSSGDDNLQWCPIFAYFILELGRKEMHSSSRVSNTSDLKQFKRDIEDRYFNKNIGPPTDVSYGSSQPTTPLEERMLEPTRRSKRHENSNEDEQWELTMKSKPSMGTRKEGWELTMKSKPSGRSRPRWR